MEPQTKSPDAATSSSASPSKMNNLITKSLEPNFLPQDISSLIDSLKAQVIADRRNFIKDRIEENKKKLSSITNHMHHLANPLKNVIFSDADTMKDFSTQRKDTILCTLSGPDLHTIEKDNSSYLEDNSSVSSIGLLGNSFSSKNNFRHVKLDSVAKLPPYTTWIFLDRNQRMTEDQSILGRRRIYYDQNCGEALICSDSEEEAVEGEEEKREFGNGEEYILRKAIEEIGSSDTVLDYLARYFDRKSSDIKAKYENNFKTDKSDTSIKKSEKESDIYMGDALKEKDLEAALDSFDNLFCRRCLVFDCKLHGCSQDLVFPAEKQVPWTKSDETTACCNQCYRLASKMVNISIDSNSIPVVEGQPHSSGSDDRQLAPRKVPSVSVQSKFKLQQSESASSNAKRSDSSESEVNPQKHVIPQNSTSPSKVKLAEKGGVAKKGNSKRILERALVSAQKKQKKITLPDSICQREIRCRSNSHKVNEDISSSRSMSPITRNLRNMESLVHISHTSDCMEAIDIISGDAAKSSPAGDDDEDSRKEEFANENPCKPELINDTSWNVIEKSLYMKGLEIFGKNSCLIARNLLQGMKTCNEIQQYSNFIETKTVGGTGDVGSQVDGHKSNELRRRSRFLRRRGRVRRLKYTWKSAGYHSIRKRISERKDQPCRQYNPCNCQSACGKQCSCLLNGTCCEKYCGCPKICKNRFRGCHCAKSQCRSRQCPCFASNRECDPDVCRNCWVGCGDGSFGEPFQRGDNYECRNMKLLLKQQQRVLLGRSDISGWGAFLKNSVNKHEYLGEYTGELISHREADKRGKIYDRENSSFLFNLNDQFVLDAYRKGDKLKFANHSPNPNCYAKVIMVAGDHRVGIFAKDRIGAGEELFYDYRYEADRAPAWARRPETSSLKKDETQPSGGRAKKLA